MSELPITQKGLESFEKQISKLTKERDELKAQLDITSVAMGLLRDERDSLRIELDKLQCAYGNVCDNAVITEKERDNALEKLKLSEAQVIQLLDENNMLKLDYSHSEAENAKLSAKCAEMRGAFKEFECKICNENHKFQTECNACLSGEPSYCTCDKEELVDCPCCMEGEYAEGYKKLRHALSDQCGAGWLSPEKATEWRKDIMQQSRRIATEEAMQSVKTLECKIGELNQNVDFMLKERKELIESGCRVAAQKKVLVDALEKVIPYIDHSHYVEIAKAALEDSAQ